MAFEKVALFGLIDMDLESTGAATLTLSTDLPGNALALRETKAIAACTRRVERFRLQGTTKGHLYTVKLVPSGSGTIRLYGGRIWARVMPTGQWAWYQLQVIESPNEWQPVKLPIPPTGEWEATKLQIPPMGEWEAAKLPIPETGDWQGVKLPIKPTAANPDWVDLPIDQ